MASVLTTVWDDMLGQVRINHPQLVRGWFSGLELEDVADGVVRIKAANQAQLRYLEQHCHGAFCDSAQAATGRLVSVAFRSEANSGAEGSAPIPMGFGSDELPLNPECTFEHFVTGPSNRLAHAAALAVAEKPGRAYNPFFTYGNVGLGKTHLLQAICHAVRARHPEARCHYISCETFINNFIEAVERGALHQFRYRYRHVDVLLIDDIQFLAERERSQEEFFHTFNTLHQTQRQIVLSADCSPSDIPSLEDRLVSRFKSGLVALLDQPCLETRMAIVRKKAKLRCIEVPEEVISIVAGRAGSNIRELEGALIRLDALSQTRETPITVKLADEALGPGPDRPVRIPAILDLVAGRLGVKVTDLQSKKRSKSVTLPRHVCMYLARQLTPHSLEEIGGYFGGRDHTTVLHATRTITQQRNEDRELEQLLSDLTGEIKRAS